ncbi:LysM peptidoglycan-binding domain-containing protein [Weissella soli]|uniref:LysM domain-containing protein n=1 Tax=Weissella soli TaxID=155866 RepID=A0A288QUQ3_9LACO|nr:LysM domain-containing protein [Weissella soli]AOT56838.1 Spore coat protein SP96 [Weissella soli]MCT8395491.1 LysM domain-containing protein [Weissella soli]NKY83289.1 LysM peptidoglycan-binding domain-containing protein [Weissella soli]RDL05419.1 LysM domain-containing protein [Weissella soli]
MNKNNLVKNTKLVGIGIGGFIIMAMIAFGVTTTFLNITSPTSNSATSSSKATTSASSSSSSTATTSDSSSSSSTTSSASYASASTTAVKTYTVASGETLTSIFRNFATNHGLTTAEAQAQILAVNSNLTVTSDLQTGQVINLPDLP